MRTVIYRDIVITEVEHNKWCAFTENFVVSGLLSVMPNVLDEVLELDYEPFVSGTALEQAIADYLNPPEPEPLP